MSHTIDSKVGDSRNEILVGRHLLPLERRGATPTNEEKQNNYSKSKRLKNVTCVAMGLTLITLLGSGCATTGGYAQTQQQNKEQTEEIDYEHMNLLYSNRVVGKPDFYKGKAVFSVLMQRGNSDLFSSNRDGEGVKRLTSTDSECETGSFYTSENMIAFVSYNNISKSSKYHIIDQDGKNKKEITEQLYFKLAEERGIDIAKSLY